MDQKALAKGTQREDYPHKWMSNKDFVRMNSRKDDILAKSSKLLFLNGKEDPYMPSKSQYNFENKKDRRERGFRSVGNKDPMHKV